jgi:DNA-directed RNA polymerase subunit RPC12/RpoP
MKYMGYLVCPRCGAETWVELLDDDRKAKCEVCGVALTIYVSATAELAPVESADLEPGEQQA